MTAKRVHLGLIGLLVVVAIGVVFGAHEANALLETQSKDLIKAKAQVVAVNNDQQQLIKDKQEIAKYQGLNQIAKAVVPQDKNQAEAVREVVDLAAQSGIPQLSSITFPASTLGGTSGSTKGLTQVTAVSGIPGVYDLPITVSQDNTNPVNYANFISFLSSLEKNRRTAVVKSITVQPEPTNPTYVSFTLVLEEFIRP
ncbi:MAG TPA: hypothetical protein VIH90_00025 [Candidatus Saccharimonadales bacterium]